MYYIFIYLDAEEEEDPLVVHVVDLLVKSGMERPVPWVSRSKELARPAVSGGKTSNSDFRFFSKPSDVLLFCFIKIIIVPEHKVVDLNTKLLAGTRRFIDLCLYVYI